MNIEVSEKAVEWYKEELDTDDTPNIKFFPRYGGNGNVPGFSLGISVTEPNHAFASVVKDNILFFVEEEDAWYFDGADLVISYDEKLAEPLVSYRKK
ncbi:HesB/YadR/YfhF family protein [Virgibacillus halophilus]|uniref:Uncharacterized protein n=1 Tax=Tigheibacillus halophilus TaxID=361280 RepID=A0ABU5CD40_9BACI|nr:hypothetical protein [Virgibacillus halophilus]